MNDMIKNLFLWLILAIVLMSIFSNFGPQQTNVSRAEYSKFLLKVRDGQVSKITVDPDTRKITGENKDGSKFITYLPFNEDKDLINDLMHYQVGIDGKPPEHRSFLFTILANSFPVILFIGLWIYILRQMQGAGGRGAMSFGKSRARLLSEDQVKVTFADVAGVDEAKEDVEELVEFLREPEKFQNLGGRIPRGVLMIGPPGTGKTLLAKAIAGEAKVPFFTISGSDFVEMFVGVGASRVRDMFEQAKRQAPCIIFIDEIDAVGRHRGAGLGGGHDEREQTLNQLLVEMDGFEGSEGVIVIAATNRPDVLDPALLRPGRFDRQVIVGLPDIRGREQILDVHIRKVSVADDVVTKTIARGTPGFSGADLANLVNEAALLAARANKTKVDMESLDRARDKILMGAERRTMIMREEEKLNTAYHEAGHAIVGRLVPEYDPIYKVTIIPRGRALGVTMYLPEYDAVSRSKRYLESQLSVMFGGRIAEEIIHGEDGVTTGASNDIQKATEVARNMVAKWGLSKKMGPLLYTEDEGEVFLGHSVTKHKAIADDTSRQIDQEVRALIDRNYERAYKILTDNIDILHAMATALIKYETLDALQVNEIMSGREPTPPKGWDDTPKAKKPPSSGAVTSDYSLDNKRPEADVAY
ncbi:MAG: ATP-dependent zinc metalloprotease FtsH [Gammaproteobacteria bacterium]|nr:ATP-dependent zinc metalloprotease FtsH [Gammaproteobacteria bacterium]